MSDLIRRQDAIEAVAQQWLFEASVESPYVNDDDIDEYRQLAGELFKDVPSARPKRVLQGYHKGAKVQTIRHEELTSIANTRKAVSLTGSFPSARPKEYVKDGMLTIQMPTIKDAIAVDKVEIYADTYKQEYFMPIARSTGDVVEVVRCKDCIHRDSTCGMGDHRWCKLIKMATSPEDFCSYGKRRGEDDE